MLGNRYVAMLDILGFKELVNKYGTMEMVERVRNVVLLAKSIKYKYGLRYNDTDGPSVTTVHSYSPNIYEFSDSILIWTPPVLLSDAAHKTLEEAERYASIEYIVEAVGEIIRRAFVNELPMRAGIAFGECYINVEERIMIGKAINDAYDTERAQDWIGAALHKSCIGGDSPIDNHCRLGPYVIEYNIPVKPNCTPLYYAVDWLADSFRLYGSGLEESDEYFQPPKQILGLIQEHGSSTDRNDVRIKYNNTLRFFEYSRRLER